MGTAKRALTPKTRGRNRPWLVAGAALLYLLVNFLQLGVSGLGVSLNDGGDVRGGWLASDTVPLQAVVILGLGIVSMTLAVIADITQKQRVLSCATAVLLVAVPVACVLWFDGLSDYGSGPWSDYLFFR
jgi:hypothetical protein